MILSKLFTAKASWQHKDASVRVNAIENELDYTQDQDRQIIVQLAKTDSSDLVRRAALIKLNDIDLWRTIGLNDKSSSVRRFAEQKQLDLICDNNSATPISARIDQAMTLTKSQAEKVLNQSSETALIIALLNKINKPHLNIATATAKQDEALWQYVIEQLVIEQTSDINALEKLSKKITNKNAAQFLQTQIEQLQLAVEKPEIIAKETQLTLSKLLALKDNSDYQQVVTKRSELNEQWLALEAEFSCLAEDKASEFTQKYQTINQTLDKVFAAKEEQYQQTLIAEKAKKEQAQQQLKFSQFIEQTNQAITEAIFENQTIDEAAFTQSIAKFNADVEQSLLSPEQKKQFAHDAKALAQQAAQIEDIANSVSNATHLISKMSQQVPPQAQADLIQKQADFKQWLADWQKNYDLAQGILPESIKSAFQVIKSNWLEALAPLEKEQQHLFYQSQRKVSDLKRLLSSGKYNAAFGVFKKLTANYQLLTSEYQHRLQRDYEALALKMDELSDWEHYIATPRKQQLLDEIKALAERPKDNPSEQAAKVKWYRKTWNSLGHADEEVDQQLNEAFNQACEQAFEPCRLFYQEQDALRAQHLKARQQIIEQVKALNEELTAVSGENHVDLKSVEGRFNKLMQQWRNAGEVDRAVYQKVNAEFQALLKPIKHQLQSYHEKNINEKQALIKQAEQLLTKDDVFDAVNDIKSLQQQWKHIGYAGVKKENGLWRQFRAINDQVFARRAEVKNARAQESEEKINQINQNIAELTASLNGSDSKKAINAVIDSAKQRRTALSEDKYLNKSALAKFEQFIAEANGKLVAIKAKEKQVSWQNLFSVIEQLASNALSIEEIEQLPATVSLKESMKAKLLAAINNQPATNNANLRHQLTIELEIIAGVDSPAPDQSQRMALQVEMMQAKINQGQLMSKQDKLWQWISAGSITENDRSFIDRIKPIFIS
ncbi:DUF349 domain-containing protein [Colwellia sp. MEBiC06753]